MRAFIMIACLGFGCGEEEDSLDGSVQVSLGYDRVTTRLIGDSLEVRYLRDVSGGVEEVAELVINDVGSELEKGLRVDLAPDNASVGRSVTDGSRFPELEGGTLDISEGGQVGDVLRGRFGVVFVTGATLSGTFSATLEQVTAP